MAPVIGPALVLRPPKSPGTWRLSVLVACPAGEHAPGLRSVSGDGYAGCTVSEPSHLTDLGGWTLYTWDISVERGQETRTIGYRLGDSGAVYDVHIPPRSLEQLHIAYASCNGYSSRKERRDDDDPFERWADLRARHGEHPYHLLILGGDQVYADMIWDDVPYLRNWVDKPFKEQAKAKPTKKFYRDVEQFYAKIYEETWNQRDVAHMMARVPALMMWDDHDIFDGWGSHKKDDDAHKRDIPITDAIFQTAKRFFYAFQLHADPDERADTGFLDTTSASYALTLDEVGILAPDLRTHRQRDQILPEESWDKIFAWLRDLNGVRHLFVLSSVPVVYLRLEAIEAAIQAGGQVESFDDMAAGEKARSLEDDLRDHWLSAPHRDARKTLIDTLFETSRRLRCKVTLLSGDVHMGAAGAVKREPDGRAAEEADRITQLISSPITHPIPPTFARTAMKSSNMLANVYNTLLDEDTAGSLTAFDSTGQKLIEAKNWLELTVTAPDGRVDAAWHVQGREHPLRRHIRPVGQ